MHLSDKQKGIGLSLFGVLIITPDSLLMRLINLPDWELLFYRGLTPFIFLFIILSLYYKKKLLHYILVTGLSGLLFAILIALGNTTFVISILNTNVANTLVMIALTPFATAVLSSIFLKEHPSKKMWIIITSCFIIVLFIFYDSFQSGKIFGDIFGFLTAVFVGGSAVVVRYSKSFNFLPPLLVSKLFTVLISIIFLQSFTEPFNIDLKQLYFILIMGLCLVIPLMCLTIAPRYIPAYEVEIFFVLETILGPIWVWLVISEKPTTKTMIGGSCIIMLILLHTFTELRKSSLKHKSNIKDI